MKTYNFDLRYIEIALSKMYQIEEFDHDKIVELIGYLQCVPEYSLDFPNNFKFKLPNGKRDNNYDFLEGWLIKNGLFVKENKRVKLTDFGRDFFQEFEQKCIDTKEAFSHYFKCRC